MSIKRAAPARQAARCARRTAALMALLLTGCGHSASSIPRIADRADVNITLDSERRTCVVALAQEQQGSTVKCEEVVPFLKDELRVKPGTVYDVHITRDFDRERMAQLGASLNGAGYRFIGGRDNPLLAQPSNNR